MILTALISERATYTSAVAAGSMPWWLPKLQPWSEVAAVVLPILGCTWFLLQIGAKLYTFWRRPPGN